MSKLIAENDKWILVKLTSNIYRLKPKDRDRDGNLILNKSEIESLRLILNTPLEE